MSESFRKFCLKVIFWGSALILFFPLFVYQGTLFPYIFSKIIAFRIIVEILLFFWLLLAWTNKKYRPNWKHPLVLSLTIFIGILVLTMLTGVDFQRSFWSTQERMTGVLTWLHFWAWFLILTSCLKKKEDWLNLVKFSLLISVLTGLYAFGQKWGFEFLPRPPFTDVLVGPFGNPIFLGVYALLHIFLAGFLAFQTRERSVKVAALIISLFNLIVMIMTGSRGALIGFISGVFLFLIFKLLTLRSFKLKIFLLVIIFIFIGAFIFTLFSTNASWLANAPSVQHLIGQGFVSWGRTNAWKIAWQGFLEKPFLGWGWENYNVVFNQFYNPESLLYGSPETWFDRSHNQVLDILCLTGIFGLIAYLAVFFSISWLFKKNKQQTEGAEPIRRGSASLLILFVLFFAYFIQNLFVFDTPGPMIVFFFSLGLFYVWTQKEEIYSDNRVAMGADVSPGRSPSGLRPSELRILPPLLLIFLFIFLPLGIYKFNIEPFQKSNQGIKGLVTSLVDLRSGLYWYEQSLKGHSFTNPETRLQIIKTIYVVRHQAEGAETQRRSEGEDAESKGAEAQRRSEEIIKKGVEIAIEENKKSIEEHPLDVKYYLYLGQFYNTSRDFNPSYLKEAEKVLEKGLLTSPKRQEALYEIGKTKIFLGKKEEGLAFYQQALELDERVVDSHLNLVLAYSLVGEKEKAKEEFKKLKELWPKEANQLLEQKLYEEYQDFKGLEE